MISIMCSSNVVQYYVELAIMCREFILVLGAQVCSLYRLILKHA